MSHIFEQIFVLLVIFQYTHQQPSPELFDEKATVSLKCDPPNKGNIINWIRVRGDSIEFIASFTTVGEVKMNSYPTLFSAEKIAQNILILKEFQKARDSGIYSCTSFNKNKLHFGKATHIQGTQVPSEVKPTKTVAAASAALPRPCPSVPCKCQTPTDVKLVHPSIQCEMMIFAPLAGGCGLLILILIVTICYCNRMRTKRCPHHYKKTPKNPGPVRQASPDRYV